MNLADSQQLHTTCFYSLVHVVLKGCWGLAADRVRRFVAAAYERGDAAMAGLLLLWYPVLLLQPVLCCCRDRTGQLRRPCDNYTKYSWFIKQYKVAQELLTDPVPGVETLPAQYMCRRTWSSAPATHSHFSLKEAIHSKPELGSLPGETRHLRPSTSQDVAYKFKCPIDGSLPGFCMLEQHTCQLGGADA